VVCLLLCFALSAPPAAISAAPGTPRTGGAFNAAGADQQAGVPASGGAAAFAAAAAFRAGNEQSEAAGSNGKVTGAQRAGQKLATSTAPVHLRKTVDKLVAGKQNLKLPNSQNNNKNSALAAFAAPERVFSLAPTTPNPTAAADVSAAAAGKATNEVVRVVKTPASTVKTGADEVSAFAKPTAASKLDGSIAVENTAKENRVSNLTRDAGANGVSVDAGREPVSVSAKMSPEMATPSALERQISSTNKTEQVGKFDAPASNGVLNATSAAAPAASDSLRAVSSPAPAASSLETKAAVAPVALPSAATPKVAELVAAGSVEDTATEADPEATEAGTVATTAATAAAFAPPNDNFGFAQAIGALPGSTTGSNIGATKEPGEPLHAYSKGGASVWFRWQSPATRSVDFSTAGSGFDTTLAVYTGTHVASLNEVASNDQASATDTTSRVTFDAVAGQVYYIAVDGFSDGYAAAQGAISLNWNVTPAPANNGFGAAQLLAATTTGSVTGTNRGATIQAYEPFHAGNDGGKSVWYKWQAPATGSIEFSTAGSNFDTLLGVYTGTTLSSLIPVASNDEEDFNASIHTGRVVFKAVAGTIYYIAVDGFYDGRAADWGDITLAWKVGPPAPVNDNFATAQSITGNEGRIKGSNWLATKEAGEPAHATVAGGKSVWYRFQAPGTGMVSFDTLGSTIDTVMGVYTGTSASALTTVTSNNDADAPGGVWTSRVTFNAVAGTVYYIAVDAWNGEAGTIILRTPRKAGKVAFASNRDGDDEIFIMNGDGGEQQQLTANTAADTRPDWSPDGTKIVFESNRDGNTELYVMNADGTGQTRLTTNTANDNQPVWSPDGTKIAFTSDRAIGAGDGNGNGGYELYVMNADGTNVVRLTYQEGTDSRPEWSPDGGKLIFASNFFGGNWDIHRLSAVTGNDKWRLTTHAATETNPVVTPDATGYTFQSNFPGNNDIFVVNSKGATINLTNNPASDEAPDYSPDGRSIIFSSTRDGNSDIYVMNADGTGQRNISFNLAADTFPDWQPVTATPNNLPTVSLTAPLDGAMLAAPATISLGANAGDTGGAIANVAFYAGSTLIATDTAAPYSASWAGVGAGTYSLTAVATDNSGAKTTSAAVRVTVNPTLSVTVENPTAGTTLDTASKVTINAQAAANTNAIGKVEFYYAAAATPATKTLIGADTTAPYSIQWDTASPAIAAGSYVISAKVTDSALATATSANVGISIKAPVVNPPAASCVKTVTANVVAFDQVYTYNRFGAFNPAGMMYALKRDVVAIDSSRPLAAGNVQLRADKRPRPLVLRVNEGDCLQVTFTNLLTANRADLTGVNNTNQPDKQNYTGRPIEFLENNSTFTRAASMHVNGLDYVNSPGISDGANVGKNTSSLVESGQTKTYTWYGRKQGQYMIHSMGANVGGEGDGGQAVLGLFGAVVVEPQGAKWYRSQLTAAQLAKVTTGRNPDGTPKINFEATDAAGLPLLNMLSTSNEIVHTDVNALITNFTENCTNAPPSSTCGQPFREFVVVFHDETKTVQAFPELDAELFHGVRDGFAINYGSASLGAPLVANRKKVGPSKDCGECKFEEFFLESWANGDPSMVVRTDSYGRASEVLFPDDPSGVHHSYLGDPVRFRNIHVGPKETHVFHLHAHQWLHEPREDDSTYLDSQTIGPGSGFTYEINYGGSGNRNFTVGDSIFHCHLYPHFAQGMWELWRVHDVFEQGTPDRNLPDAEIAGGTPNPAVVPLPNRVMPPMPTADMKGFPFFVAAQAGHRPPQPPLDIEQDGGLPRHRILASQFIDGKDAIHPHLLTDPVAARVLSLNNDPNLLAFARELTSAKIELLPHDGTITEKKAMEFHEGKGGLRVTTQYGWPAAGYPGFTPTGASGLFLVNGQPRQPGAPFAEPCAPGTPLRNYRAAYIQFDMTVNRAGWHDRQARITTLEDDALATRDGLKAPEPFFFRTNSNDCIQFKATNLVPHVLNLDDFQIFTPTDTIGQHIHLVKFDVMASDGAGNGWNYEDGTFSPGEVQERVHANNHHQNTHGGSQILSLVTNPKFGGGPDLDGNGIGDYVGAQTTTQRWWADPLLNNNGVDRTIRTVFTHDHFGPSSHQHHGLYGALVVEPAGSRWETTNGTPMGTRADGGPTSYAANILPGDASRSYREFNLAIADFALVYTKDLKPINPPGRKEIGLPFILEPPAIPQPESISADDPGTGLINYRNEPIPLRVRDAATNTQLTDARGDMANVFRSQDDAGNTIHGDPFTPLLEAYEGDKVQIRLIQGAQEEQHVFSLHGGKWLHEPSSPNSGWYNAQAIGISEHFEFEVPPIPAVGNIGGANKDVADFMYGSFATDNLWNGMWGILRSYRGLRNGLKALPSNSAGTVSSSDAGLRTDFCPAGAPQRSILVGAWLARDLVGPNGIVYNNKYGLKDPAGIVFVQQSDVADIKAGTKKLEPLVLRANAGDCINLELTNNLPPGTTPLPDYDAWNLMPMLTPQFNLNQLKSSKEVSLHPQLLEYDVRTSDGANVGLNDKQTVSPGMTKKYRWYAGKLTVNPDGSRTAQPIEYGAINLTDYGDIMKHGSHGAGGVLVVEPIGATWTTPADSNAEAEVRNAAGSLLFKEFVVVYQDDVKMLGPNTAQGQTILGLAGVNPVRNYTEESDSEDSGMKAFNYRTEPLWARLGFLQEMTKRDHNTFQHVSELLNDVNQANAFSSTAYGDPETPIFSVAAGTGVRFRVVQPTGHPRQHGFTLYGHNWFHEPWRENSTVVWSPGFAEPSSTTIGTQGGHTARRHWNIVLRNAGGAFSQPGDYMYRTQESFNITSGMWGIFRVTGATTTATPTTTTAVR
jgi:Tol biopolymer transport system component